MKKVVIILIVAFLGNSLIAQIKKQEVKSKINEITVFYTSAEIEREATVNLKKGMNKLVYSNITPKINKESIYAIVNKGIDVVSINTHKKVIYPDRKRIDNLSDSVKQISKNINKIKTELIILNKQIAVLDDNSDYSSRKDLSVNQIIEFTKYYDNKIRSIYKNINQNKDKLEQLENKYQITTNKLNQLKSTAVRYDNMVIELVVLTKKETKLTNVKLKYLVGGTGWSPIYKINVNQLEDNINMNLQAKVINQTGINWDNTKLVFSTSSPDKSQDTPDLASWNLNFDNQTINEGRLDKYKVKDISKEKAQNNNNGLDVVNGVKYIETDDFGMNNTYKTSNKYYIPSDSKAYFIDIEEYSLPVTYRYYSVPKVDADAFLIAKVTDWEKYKLIEGQSKVWFNGNFVGESYIRPQLALDTLDISLGRDNKIFVSRVKLKDKDSEKLIGTNKKQTFKYKLTVKNTNSTSVKFTLRDQIPVSQDDDIKIDKIELSNAELDEDSGNLKWRFNLEPGESKEFYVAFSVKFPKNKSLRVRGTRNTSSCKSVRFL